MSIVTVFREIKPKKLGSATMESDKDGTRFTVVSEGILVQTSVYSHLSLLNTRIDDRTALESNRDGINGFEDIETIVSSTALLANDTLGDTRCYRKRSCYSTYLKGCRSKVLSQKWPKIGLLPLAACLGQFNAP